MNKFIEEQLKSLKVAQVQKISDTEYLIQKVSEDPTKPVQGQSYIIELADYILHPSDNFTLASNWNRGITPTSKYLKCTITQIMGKMLKIDGVGYSLEDSKDLQDSYLGLWLPMGGIKIIGKLI